MMNLNQKNICGVKNAGFTLIEMLVVVMIVGILSAIALPQYQDAVEKARVTEAMVTSKAIIDAIERHLQARPDDLVNNSNQISDVDLKGGSWTSSDTYETNLFSYVLAGSHSAVNGLKVTNRDGLYSFTYNESLQYNTCFPTAGSEQGQKICNFLDASIGGK